MLTHRYATGDITAPDGTFIPKGALVASNLSRMWDPTVFHDPEDWQPDRFLKLREQPGKEHSAQLVTTNTEGMGFGLGTYAYPGRSSRRAT